MASPSIFVFNEAYYLAQPANSDVAAAVKAGALKSGLEHWQAYGANEGRSASAFFDWEVYRDNNQDLIDAGIDTQAELTLHYTTYGYKEQRISLSSMVFNADVYASQNPDLAAAGITDRLALEQHFKNNGIYEGRVSVAGFDPVAYINANTDLKALLDAGGNINGFTKANIAKAGWFHYLNWGIGEGRTVPAVNPTFTVTAASNTVTEGNALTFTVSTSVLLTTDTTFTYNVTGDTNGGTINASSASDFGTVTGTVTIPAGVSSWTFTVTPSNDSSTEGLEGFKVTLFNSSLTAVATSSPVAIVDGVTPPSSLSFTLTTGSDNFTGGTVNDTFNASLSSGGNALNSGDILDGGTGTDTLSVTSTLTDTTTIAGVTSTGIEVLAIQNLNSDASENITVDATNFTGVTTVQSNSSTADVAVTNLKNVVNATLNNSANGADLSIGFQTAAVSGTADASTLTLNNVASSAVTINGIENLTIASTGAANTVSLTDDSLRSVTVTGSQNLSLGTLKFADAANGGSSSTVAKVTASAFTGALTVDLGASTGAYASVVGGSGNDSITLATLSTNTTVDGGAGTADVLVVKAITTASTAFTNVKNIETLQLGFDATGTDLTKAGSAFSTVSFGVAQSGNLTVASGSTVDLSSVSSTVSLVVANAATQTTDALTLAVGTSSKGNTAAGTITASNIENLTVRASGSDNAVNTFTITDTGATSLTVTGSGATKITLSGATGLTSINASAATGSFNGTSVSVGTNATLLGGSAADTLVAGSGNDSVNGGGGNDTLTFAANLNNSDTVDGGAGTADSLTATIGGLTATTGKLNVSNVETLTLAAASAATIDATSIKGASTINVTGSATVSLTNLAAGTGVGIGNSTDVYSSTLTAALADATGTADALTVNVKATADVTATLVTSNIETINIAGATSGKNGAALTLTDVTAATINATGSFTGKTLALGKLNASVTTLDVSGVTAGTVSATIANTSASTVKGTAAANNLTGGDGNDSFTISSGFDINDSIAGGAGTNDSLTATIDSASVTMNAAATVSFANLSAVENVTIHVADAIASTDTDITVDTVGGLVATNLTVTGNNSLIGFTVAGSNGLGSASSKSINFGKFAGKVDVEVEGDAAITGNTITGGAGTADSIHIQVSEVNNAPRIAGFENIEISTTGTKASTLDTANITGYSTLALSGAESITLNNLAAASTISVGVSSTGALNTNKIAADFADAKTITLGLASTSGTADAVTLNLVKVSGVATGLTLVGNGVESWTLNASDADNFKVTLQDTNTNAVSLKLTGGKAANTFTLTTVQDNVSVIDAGSLLSNFSITTRDGTSAMTITSGSGNDTIQLQNANDVLDAGGGTSDTLTVTRSAPLGGVVVDLSSTVDQISFFNGANNTAVQKGFENVNLSGYTGGFGSDVTGSSGNNNITGTSWNDLINAGAGNDVVSGGDGNDTIVGGAGNDDITGGAGNDSITGGAGADTLNGGAGSDIYVFTATSDGSTTPGSGDTIATANFLSGTDVLQFTNAGFGTLGTGNLLVDSNTVAFNTDEATTLAALTTAAGTDANVYTVNLTGSTLNQALYNAIDAAVTAGTAATGPAFYVVSNGTDTVVLYDADANATTAGSLVEVVKITGLANAITGLANGDLVIG